MDLPPNHSPLPPHARGLRPELHPLPPPPHSASKQKARAQQKRGSCFLPRQCQEARPGVSPPAGRAWQRDLVWPRATPCHTPPRNRPDVGLGCWDGRTRAPELHPGKSTDFPEPNPRLFPLNLRHPRPRPLSCRRGAWGRPCARALPVVTHPFIAARQRLAGYAQAPASIKAQRRRQQTTPHRLEGSGARQRPKALQSPVPSHPHSVALTTFPRLVWAKPRWGGHANSSLLWGPAKGAGWAWGPSFLPCWPLGPSMGVAQDGQATCSPAVATGATWLHRVPQGQARGGIKCNSAS